MSSLSSFIYGQLFVSSPSPTTSFAGKLVIVTGRNTGHGLEAVRHFTRLVARAVILAVRNLSKGGAAKKCIGASTHCPAGTVQLAVRAEKERYRVDVLLKNAGIVTLKSAVAKGNELTLTPNAVAAFLETAREFGALPNLIVTASEMRPAEKYLVTVNCVNLALSFRAGKGLRLFLYFLKPALARTTEYGSRTLVHTASRASVWDNLMKKLEAIKPGVSSNL
ncbi:hypothetical protein K432DRAFT_433344 [Lepidopterella palustris CBS 459.81]|uniref:NAD(P)-binding protein n=1 Tax=Lepidopterella palustris CBS 459.81 TaxID=1314670 RepID=A0A8E2JHG9_9PEZI|nr:hypothetical protein K432DRAFT_433344 [Lepidopterella palustris CBS 459.81]